MKKVLNVILVLLMLAVASCATAPSGSKKEGAAPAVPKGMVRLNYHRFDKNYSGWGIHAWGAGYNGPEIAWEAAMPTTGESAFGVYWDIPYSGEGELNFIIHKGDTKDPDGDRKFSSLDSINEYWSISGDETEYKSLKDANNSLNNKILSAAVLTQTQVKLKFRMKNLKDITLELDGVNVELESVRDVKGRIFYINTKEILNPLKEYIVKSGTMSRKITFSWESIDSGFTYDGELGAIYSKSQTEFRLWSPLASAVVLTIYKDGTDDTAYKTLELTKGDMGVWSIVVSEDLKGLFYTYDVTNGKRTKRVLDPYAKSMAAFNEAKEKVGRAAIVDLSSLGPKLDFAKIDGYEKREDAIIWEIHVRDFTSDPSLKTTAQFGTYKAFIEKLDYIKSLGVTHVQLLPVMNFYFGDELNNVTREGKYSAGPNTYNWGYDPHNYFSPEGMYSENPRDPELRVAELKELINAIHDSGMGVILDAVYNHTAKISIFEDIIPGYYHFMDTDGKAKSSYGGGRMGSTHAMTRKLIVDSMLHWVTEYKVDGFRHDLMGELDGETIQIAFDKAQKVNPNIIMIGEGWRTYSGDDGDKRTPADQSWMAQTEAAGTFSDEMRNELKSGFGSEGQPRFMTGGKRDIKVIFNNVAGRPGNMTLDDPGDVVQYVAAHDNLPLHDVIAQSIKKDPDHHEEEIQKRIRLANTMVLTSQGTAFIHAGQEYGRTKQWRTSGKPKVKGTQVKGFDFPWFVHDSYDSSDAVNMIDWKKIESDGIQKDTVNYTKGLIALRRSTDAFRLGEAGLVNTNVELMDVSGIKSKDNIIAYTVKSTDGEIYSVIINADNVSRELGLNKDLTTGTVLVDSDESGITAVTEVTGAVIESGKITLDALTAIIIKE